MGVCQNHGALLGPLNNKCRFVLDPKRGHNFDSHPYGVYKDYVLILSKMIFCPLQDGCMCRHPGFIMRA